MQQIFQNTHMHTPLPEVTSADNPVIFSPETLIHDFHIIQEELLCSGCIHLDVETQNKCSAEILRETLCIVSNDPTIPILCMLEGGQYAVLRVITRKTLTGIMLDRFGI